MRVNTWIILFNHLGQLIKQSHNNYKYIAVKTLSGSMSRPLRFCSKNCCTKILFQVLLLFNYRSAIEDNTLQLPQAALEKWPYPIACNLSPKGSSTFLSKLPMPKKPVVHNNHLPANKLFEYFASYFTKAVRCGIWRLFMSIFKLWGGWAFSWILHWSTSDVLNKGISCEKANF